FDSYVQPARGIPGTGADARRAETEEACDILGVGVEFLALSDMSGAAPEEIADLIRRRFNPSVVWAPAFEQNGHDQHNLVAQACDGLPVVDRYLTYTRTRGKTTSGRKVD